MKKVSVIVSVYNQEKKIVRCIKSIIKQSYTELEIIIVNDGSTDKTQLFCEQLERQDDRIILMNTENGGLEASRIIGKNTATGAYLNFVDGDDFLPKQAIEKLVLALEKNNADISFGSFVRIIGKNGLIRKKNITRICRNQVFSGEDILNRYLGSFAGGGDLPLSIWGKLYRKSLLDQKDIEAAHLFYGEDQCFNLQVMPRAHKIVTIPDTVYYYRWGGATTKRSDFYFKDSLQQYQFKCRHFKKYQRPDWIESANVELIYFFLAEIERNLLKYDGNFAEVYNQVQKEFNSPAVQSAIDSLKEVDIQKDPSNILAAVFDRDLKSIINIKITEIERRRWKRHLFKVLSLF